MIQESNTKMPKRRKNNFIDNKQMFVAFVEYRKLCDIAKEKGLARTDPDWPRIPKYIGKCFLDIAEHLSMRPNFSNYMFRQDMVCDAIENCCIYAHNFDPEKSKNPFSYFTQVCWYAFIRRIGKEKRQIDICDKIISKSGFEEFFVGDGIGASSDYNSIKDLVAQRRKGNK